MRRVLMLAMVMAGMAAAGALADPANGLGGAATEGAATQAAATGPSTRAAGWAVEWTVEKKAHPDAVRVVAEGEAMVVEVTYGGGIGGVTVKLTEGQWPKQVKVKLHGFGNLESFGAGGSRWQVGGNLKGGSLDWGRSRKDDGTWADMKVPEESRGAIKQVGKDEIEVDVPVLGADKELVLSWVDAFRG